tara:strand:+ start:189 stop:731 length:543 start_codon:yes stop_codon:yes gene_type:complete
MVYNSVKDGKEGRYIKIKQAAEQLYDLVKDEKRADGTPAFKSWQSMYSNLHNALHRGYIDGAKESPHVTWIHMDKAEEYIMAWIEQAVKTTGPIRLMRKKKHSHVGKRTHSLKQFNGDQSASCGVSSASVEGSAYLLVDTSGKPVASIEASGEWAAASCALRHLGYQIHPVPKVIKHEVL